MSTKQEKIQQMLDMQKKFMALEHEHGIDAVDYFTPKEGSELDGYREAYHKLAMEVMETAHAEVGSER